MLNKSKAFTLVEILVALAVGAIIVVATYASYELVATQYKKNMDIADMHTSGRAIMRIIDRDVRMAGFEYRDKDAKVTYGSISSPLTIKDSGDKCCDEVTVVYDYFDEEAKKAERIRIRYWTEAYTSNKGSRHRLYKQKDILGQNKKILTKPKLGNKEVMADYIEDLQFVNITTSGLLYVGTHYKNIMIVDPVQKKAVGSIRGLSYSASGGMAFGPGGLLYVGSSNKIMIVDPVQKKEVGSIKGLSYPARRDSMAFGPDGLLYVGTHYKNIMIVDPVQKKEVGSIKGLSYPASGGVAFGPDGLLYVGTRSHQNIMIVDPVQKKEVRNISRFLYYNTSHGLTFGPDGLLYFGTSGRQIMKVNVVTGQTSVIRGWGQNDTGVGVFGPDGTLYLGVFGGGNPILIVDPVELSTGRYNMMHSPIYKGINYAPQGLAMKTKSTGQESLVTINLTLRTRNEYGKDRQFKKKDYHGGNFKIDKTDKYKRDTFSSTVLVRNLVL